MRSTISTPTTSWSCGSEHDLFDQLNLIQVLSRLAAHGTWPKPVSLICIGSFPGRPRFKGLGELTVGELGPLFEHAAARHRRRSTPWPPARGPRSARPIRRPSKRCFAPTRPTLPYLAAALARHLEEFPSAVGGLSRTERRLLELAATGPIALRAAFPQMHDEETAFYIADLSFLHVAVELSSPFAPLLTIRARSGPDRQALNGTIELTDLGRDLLAGRDDRIVRCGIDRWLGGVHLTGPGPHGAGTVRTSGSSARESLAWLARDLKVAHAWGIRPLRSCLLVRYLSCWCRPDLQVGRRGRGVRRRAF